MQVMNIQTAKTIGSIAAKSATAAVAASAATYVVMATVTYFQKRILARRAKETAQISPPPAADATSPQPA